MRVNEFRHGIFRRPDAQDKIVLIEVGDVAHCVHRAVVSGDHVILVSGAVVSPPLPALSGPHPWGEFLKARMRCLVWLRDEMGETPEKSAQTLSMDPGQVRLLLMTADAEACST